MSMGVQKVAQVGAPPAASKWKTLMPFIVISISYLLFTITDGGVRMVVLLHAYNQGFTAMVRARLRAPSPRARGSPVRVPALALSRVHPLPPRPPGSGHHVHALRARRRGH